MSSRRSLFCALVGAVVCLPATVLAQRGKPELEWSGRSVLLDHGRPSFGRHSLDELPPGQRWRMGSNEASTLLVGAPLLAGNAMVAPGHYRVQLYRDQRDPQRFFLQVDGAGWALGEERQVEYLRGSIDDAALQKKLQVRWVASDDEQKAGSEKANHDVAMEIRFGEYQVDVPMTMLGARPFGRVGAYTLTAYTVPASVLEKRMEKDRPTVVASLEPRKKVRGRKQPPFFNLVLRSRQASLVPAQRAPVDSFGFAELEAYDAAWTEKAGVEWIDKEESSAHFAITEAEADKKALTLTFVFGVKLGAVTLDLPRGPKR